MDTSIPWALVVVGGPIILGGVLLWAILNNRMSRRDKAASHEPATRVRREQEADDRRRDGAN